MTIDNGEPSAAVSAGSEELVALRQENRLLREAIQRRDSYIREKVNQLLDVMGTKPLREEELDGETIQEFDPLGIIFVSFRQILSTLKDKNSQLQMLHDEMVAIFAAAQVGIMVVDTEFNLISSNEMMKKIFVEMNGVDGALEVCCRDVVCKGEIPDELCAVRRILAGAEVASFRGWEARGHIFNVEAAPIRDSDGAVKRIVLVYNDITDLKHAQDELSKLNEELEQRVTERTALYQDVNKELTSFCYSVSHDLRAPLRHVSGFAHILHDDYHDKLDEAGRDILRRICAVSEKMGRMIDELLRISRVSRATMEFADIDLSKLANNAARMFAESEPSRKVTFKIAEGLMTRGDKTLLEIVMQNLIGNAWKYSANNPEAVIEFGMTVDKDRDVYFVRDNGTGFDMTYCDKLFRVFERLHGDEFEGSGIGLATVHRIISRHRGEVWADSEIGKGATFFFTLPKYEQL